MNVTVKERMILLAVLPNQGDITTLKIMRKLREELSFSEDEHKKINLRQGENGNWFWDAEIEKDVEIGEKALEVISKSFKELNQKEQLHMDHLDVYERFVEKGE